MCETPEIIRKISVLLSKNVVDAIQSKQLQGSSTVVIHCILTATNSPTADDWTVWLTVSAPGFETGLVGLVCSEA
jgi:hypothetical protein